MVKIYRQPSMLMIAGRNIIYEQKRLSLRNINKCSEFLLIKFMTRGEYLRYDGLLVKHLFFNR